MSILATPDLQQPRSTCLTVKAYASVWVKQRGRAGERGLSAMRCALALLPALAAAKDMHASFQSTRGVQHEVPLISDDFVVGCIMVMFLMLFAFGVCIPLAST